MSEQDSPRWCSHCNAYGDHHTDRHVPDPQVQQWTIYRDLPGGRWYIWPHEVELPADPHREIVKVAPKSLLSDSQAEVEEVRKEWRFDLERADAKRDELVAELAESQERERQLREAIEAVIAERSHGVTANWEFVDRTLREALA